TGGIEENDCMLSRPGEFHTMALALLIVLTPRIPSPWLSALQSLMLTTEFSLACISKDVVPPVLFEKKMQLSNDTVDLDHTTMPASPSAIVAPSKLHPII